MNFEPQEMEKINTYNLFLIYNTQGAYIVTHTDVIFHV